MKEATVGQTIFYLSQFLHFCIIFEASVSGEQLSHYQWDSGARPLNGNLPTTAPAQRPI